MEILISVVFLVFGVLQIILFFKIWGMTDDIKSIKEKYLKEDNFTDVTEEDETGDPLRKGVLVQNINTGKQMRIKEITQDGKYSCYSNNGLTHEGDFDKIEIKPF